tara:strand:+ start:4458 stop:4655 length:198 start_codon:yes stop_codon:yes gene_type:complete
MDIKTTSEAFTLALTLAVTGTDEAKVKKCKEMAEYLASQMTDKEVELCFASAERAIQYAEEYSHG